LLCISGSKGLQPWVELIVIKFLQGSVVTQTVLLQTSYSTRICDKNYENWLTVDQVILMITRQRSPHDAPNIWVS